jgi:hypothetical protein
LHSSAAAIYNGITLKVKDHTDIKEAALHVRIEFSWFEFAACFIPDAYFRFGAVALLIGCVYIEPEGAGKWFGGGGWAPLVVVIYAATREEATTREAEYKKVSIVHWLSV